MVDCYLVDSETYERLKKLNSALFNPKTVKNSGGRIDGNWLRDCANTLFVLLRHFEEENEIIKKRS